MTMHRFTDPSPASFAGRARVDLVISSWEIECCAPPPVVGQDTTWALQFASASANNSGLPAWVPEREWEIADLPGVGPVVSDGVITAEWAAEEPPPPAGRTRLAGSLSPDRVVTATGAVRWP